MNLADAVTITRIVLSPALYAAGFLLEETIYLVLFIIGAVSDGLDGFLARRSKKTGYGHLLDGVADALFYPSCIFMFFFIPDLRTYGVLIGALFVVQMFSVIFGWLRGKANNPHLLSGKINAVVMCTMVIALLLFGFHSALIWILLVSGFVSAADRIRSTI